IKHRRERENAILSCIKSGHATIDAIVAHVYQRLDPALKIAAAYSVLAHIEDLAERGLVRCQGPLALGSAFRSAANKASTSY
ncbi:MAG TPA: MBL fold metallo-hydrolase, partial [Methylocella sp.]|nr:MBL fold metallo-hydrolase [Methylocella sp.]